MKLAVTCYPGDIPMSAKIAMLEGRPLNLFWISPEDEARVSKLYRKRIVGHMNGVRRRRAKNEIQERLED